MIKADVILRSNAIFTGKDDSYISGSIAIASNKIIAVKENSKLEEFQGRSTQIYELGNKLIIPGFVDAHFHFFEGAIAASEYMCCQIESSTSEEDCIRIMKQFADENPQLQRLVGTGWLQSNWNGAPLPSCESLDQVFGKRPVYLLSGDGHTFWLNTAALEECGITAETSVDFGEIGKKKDGALNGILLELAACALAWNRIYAPEKSIMEKAYLDLSNEALSYGITSLCNMSSKTYYDEGEELLFDTAYRLSQENLLKSRMHLYPCLGTGTDFSSQKKLRDNYSSDKFKVSGLKQFVDGMTATYTGYLLEPYEDRPSTNGMTNYPAHVYEASILAANKEGFPVRLHTIADGSVRLGLDIFEKARKESGNTGIRNSLEHCENIAMEDINWFHALDVVASIQPIHMILDADGKAARIGKKRAKLAWPAKTLMNLNTVVAFGSDYTVAHFNPLPNIQAAVTRCDENGTAVGVNPEEKISVAQALRAYTYGGAYSFNREAELGTLEAGKLADIAVLETNIFEIDPSNIKDCRNYMTMVDGEIVYECSIG